MGLEHNTRQGIWKGVDVSTDHYFPPKQSSLGSLTQPVNGTVKEDLERFVIRSFPSD